MMRNERSSDSSSGSSKKGKRGSSEGKPKQPQRGLGVAQLEKIRLHGQMGACAYNNLPQYPFQTCLNIQEDFRSQQMGYSSINVPISPFSEHSSSISSTNSYGFLPTMMMGYDAEGGNIRYGDSHIIRFNPVLLEGQPIAPIITRPLLNKLQGEDLLQKKRRTDFDEYMGSSSGQNSGSSDTQELDLELRLSLR